MRVGLLIALLASLGCGVGFTYEEPASGGGGSGASAMGGDPSTGGTGGSSGGTGGEGGSMGGAPPGMLHDEDLLARYWIDEAATGAAIGTLEDDASSPEDLTLEDGGVLVWVEPSEGRRGLSFVTAPNNGQASVAMAGTKFEQLWGRSTLTLESVSAVGGGIGYSRLIDIGDNSSWSSIQLDSNEVGFLQLGLGEGASNSWPVAQDERLVIHFVLDTGQADAADRARLYVNGARVTESTLLPPALGATILEEPGAEGDTFVIGNAPAADRCWLGTIHYMAVYTGVMPDARIVEHAAYLAVRDDG